MTNNAIDILLIEDNPADVQLAREALDESKFWCNLHVIKDGESAMAFLRREGAFADAPRPDIIILDLNLPKKDGREVLREIKEDDRFKCIPVVILTMSAADEDTLNAYELGANCFITKPIGFDQFIRVVQSIENFWFTIVKLPRKEEPCNV